MDQEKEKKPNLILDGWEKKPEEKQEAKKNRKNSTHNKETNSGTKTMATTKKKKKAYTTQSGSRIVAMKMNCKIWRRSSSGLLARMMMKGGVKSLSRA